VVQIFDALYLTLELRLSHPIVHLHGKKALQSPSKLKSEQTVNMKKLLPRILIITTCVAAVATGFLLNSNSGTGNQSAARLYWYLSILNAIVHNDWKSMLSTLTRVSQVLQVPRKICHPSPDKLAPFTLCPRTVAAMTISLTTLLQLYLLTQGQKCMPFSPRHKRLICWLLTI